MNTSLDISAIVVALVGLIGAALTIRRTNRSVGAVKRELSTSNGETYGERVEYIAAKVDRVLSAAAQARVAAEIAGAEGREGHQIILAKLAKMEGVLVSHEERLRGAPCLADRVTV